MEKTTGERFERAVAIMARLRGPGGCPWDREQTFDSIKPYTLEETYEVLEAIEERDWTELPGELGDLLLQVLFYAEMAQEQGSFSIDDVLDRLCEKLVNRHPHVFGDVKAETSSEVLRNWEALKAEEKKKRELARRKDPGEETNAKSLLAGVSPGLPGLVEARKLGSRAAQVGFDWSGMDGLFKKLQEEAAELKDAIAEHPRLEGLKVHGNAGSGKEPVAEDLYARLEGEIGDLLFTVVNMARHLSVDPEIALKRTNRKFRRRFEWMEHQLHASGRAAPDVKMDELESLWQQAKEQTGGA